MRNSTRLLAFMLLPIVLGAPVRPAHAHPPGAGSGSYTLHVEDESGTRLCNFEQGEQVFVLGSHGRRYNLVLQNHTARRVEAVVTVDGRDVVTGREGDFVNGRGYVLAPYATLRIEGFRKSMDEVAAFRFSTPEASYSARMGTPEHVGVIGAAFFPERVVPPRPRWYGHEYESKRRSAPSTGSRAEAAPSAAPAQEAHAQRAPAADKSARGAADDRESASTSVGAVNNLGTEYGESRDSRVQEVRFERASRTSPALVSVLRYDNRAGLLARGIEIEPRHVSYREPNPFPHNRFAPAPP
jgi:hypothetical protein